jgi:hypothetical protein
LIGLGSDSLIEREGCSALLWASAA